jgi:hypothetical protein
MLAAWGRIIYPHRLLTLIASIVLFLTTAVAVGQGGSLDLNTSSQTESGRAEKLMISQLPHKGDGISSFVLIFGGRSLRAGDARFRTAMLAGLAPRTIRSFC